MQLTRTIITVLLLDASVVQIEKSWVLRLDYPYLLQTHPEAITHIQVLQGEAAAQAVQSIICQLSAALKIGQN